MNKNNICVNNNIKFDIVMTIKLLSESNEMMTTNVSMTIVYIKLLLNVAKKQLLN